MVQAFKSVSTAVSVLNASNKSAHAFNQTIGDGTKASIIERKKPEDLFEYLSRVIDNSVDLSIRDRRTDALGRVNQNIQERRNDAIEADRLGNNAQAVMSGPRISESGVRTESDSGSARATVDAGVGSDVQKFQRNSVRETGTGSMMMPERESRASGRERFFSEQVQTSTQGIGRSQASSTNMTDQARQIDAQFNTRDFSAGSSQSPLRSNSSQTRYRPRRVSTDPSFRKSAATATSRGAGRGADARGLDTRGLALPGGSSPLRKFNWGPALFSAGAIGAAGAVIIDIESQKD